MHGNAKCWVLSDGTIGTEKQSMALAEGVGLPTLRKLVTVRMPWKAIPARVWIAPLQAVGQGSDPIAVPWPDLVINTGGRLATIATAIRRRAKGKTRIVQIQDPRIGLAAFDLVVAPRHDGVRGPNILETDGAVNSVNGPALSLGRERFAHIANGLSRPFVSVLLGGSSRRHRFTEECATQIGDKLARLAAGGAGLLITASRRTPTEALRAIRERLDGMSHYLWDGTGDNPYVGMLGLADAIVATNDSVNMVSEAAATGKPVHIAALPGGSERFDRFLAHMNALGITRPFSGELETWSYPPLDDTRRAVAAVQALLAKTR